MEGEINQAAVSVKLDIDRWSAENYVLLPAVAYNGNKFEWRRLRYSPKLYEVQDIGPDRPTIVSDILRLDHADGFSRIQDRSGAFATPALAFQSGETNRGLILLTNYGNSLGDYGLSVQESRSREKATLAITSPVVREQYLYMNCDSRVPSWDKGKDFKAGDTVSIRFRVYGFSAPTIETLYDRFMVVRKEMSEAPAGGRNTLSYSWCQQLQEEKFNEQNFVEEHGYYAVGMRENFLQDWQIGWTGGMISTYPLLFMGSEQTVKNVLHNFDWLFPAGISPSGLFWDSGEKGTIWLGGDIRKPHTGNWHLIRKSGDGVYYIIKQFMLMEKMGIPVKKQWKEGTRKVCDTLVKIWDKNHQFGQFIDALNGEIVVGGSASGGIIPAALVLAAEYFQQEDYLRVARESGEYYYQTFTKQGMTTGGPGDALQNPDSESSYALVESYMLLHEATRASEWLAYASQAAKQFASWVVTDNYPFPENSLFGEAGIKSKGAVYANTQNKHGAPAICTASGIALLRLYRSTGDLSYLELLYDIAHNMPQYLPCPENPIGETNKAWVCERVNMTDWEGLDRIGEIVGLSTWAETGLMLTTVELPGVYIQPDRGMVTAFDNMEAEVVESNNKVCKVRIKNPTSLPAKVKVLVEYEQDLKLPLGENRLFDCPEVELKPQQSRIFSYKMK
ncbi:MAG: hypothetical protein LUE93_09935 [Bacteroides sp.]|nr:hypothetical protein [Bacteroides sp.]